MYASDFNDDIKEIKVKRERWGQPVITMPIEYMVSSATPEQKALYENLCKQVEGMVGNGGPYPLDSIVLPDNTDEHGQRLFDLELLNFKTEE